MKIPQRILGLLAVAAPVVAGCGAEATEPASTRTDQNIQSESHAATPVSSEPAEDSKASPRPDDATSPDGASPSPSSSSSSSSSSEDVGAAAPASGVEPPRGTACRARRLVAVVGDRAMPRMRHGVSRASPLTDCRCCYTGVAGEAGPHARVAALPTAGGLPATATRCDVVARSVREIACAWPSLAGVFRPTGFSSAPCAGARARLPDAASWRLSICASVHRRARDITGPYALAAAEVCGADAGLL